ncbi:Hsp20/alpha crystallin family protein [Candidatus Lokiarchaeum ossiferum]|uniref:Hsp20/alpha crystallin family protein n=1 Tax=Candidatus Lokiarchaeum ossiferum TaxID=2951803 RepID=UPI00352EAF4B
MDKKIEEKKTTSFKRRIWVPACPTCDCGCTDEDDKENVETLTFEIPGVDKDKIHLDVTKDRVRMIAHRNAETDYISEYMFSCTATLDKEPTANYNNGILTLEVPVECPDPYKDAQRLKIN